MRHACAHQITYSRFSFATALKTPKHSRFVQDVFFFSATECGGSTEYISEQRSRLLNMALESAELQLRQLQY